MVLIYISLMTKDVSVYLVRCLFTCFAQFLMRLFVLMSFKNILCV